MEKVEEKQPYPPHLKRVLKTYQKSAIKSLQGPNTVLDGDNIPIKKEPTSESSPELPLETPPPLLPLQQVPILSTADQSAELSETLIEGQRISCFIIGGEKRICFVQLLSTVLRDINAATINNVCAELFINFSSCNSEQLLALKAKGLLPPETPTCGLVTKPDAERLCSVLLHDGALSPFNFEKYSAFNFYVYHECFSGAKGVLYVDLYTERNWCVQCVVCKRFFTPQMFVCHSCYLDKKRNTVHTYIETGICHWGFDSTNWRIYLHVVEEQPDYEKCTKIMDVFKENHKGATAVMLPVKRKQIHHAEHRNNDNMKNGHSVKQSVIHSVEEEERYIAKKKAKMMEEEGCGGPVPSGAFYPSFHSYYSNLCESWVRNAAVAGYHAAWAPYHAIPSFTKDSKSQTYYLAEAVSPAYLAQASPVLLHPERVVSLSQSEYERTYQPNVSLTSSSKTSSDTTVTVSSKQQQQQQQQQHHHQGSKRSVIRIKREEDLQESYLQENTQTTTDTEEGKSVSPVIRSVSSSRPIRTPSPASTDVTPDNGISSVVEQVAAVLDALSDAEDAVRQRVISLVERLTLRIDKSELERQKYQQEISELKSQISELREENVQLFYDNNRLRQQLDKANGYAHSNRSHICTPKQPHCSPVSVITSPPPSSNSRAESVSS